MLNEVSFRNSDVLLTIRAFYELTRYEILFALGGFKRVSRNFTGGMPLRQNRANREVEDSICRAVVNASCLYWKHVRCLQSAFVTARLLRLYQAKAEVIIGYRPVPLISHAWVEIDGRVIGESAAYQARLYVLGRLS